MADKNKIEVKIGGSIWSVLLVVFIVLKVLGIGAIANWSWWWVLSPLWIPFVTVFAILFTVALIMLFFPTD